MMIAKLMYGLTETSLLDDDSEVDVWSITETSLLDDDSEVDVWSNRDILTG